MALTITVRDIPESTRNAIAAQAALEGQSMQEYLKTRLEALASRPTPKQWIAQVQRRKQRSAAEIRRQTILDHRDEDRR